VVQLHQAGLDCKYMCQAEVLSFNIVGSDNTACTKLELKLNVLFVRKLHTSPIVSTRKCPNWTRLRNEGQLLPRWLCVIPETARVAPRWLCVLPEIDQFEPSQVLRYSENGKEFVAESISTFIPCIYLSYNPERGIL
jgi:hypothetical protein